MFREETTADGERIGQYSYIDENGQTITVRYTAGKDGFRILEGNHIPEGANGLQSAPFDPEIAKGEPQQSPPAQPQAAPVREQPRPVRPVRRRPVQQRQPQSQVVAQQPQQPQPQVPSGDLNPFINPADPSHLDFQTNINAAQFRPRQPTQEIPRQRQQFQPAPVQRQQVQPAPVQRQQVQPAPVQRQQGLPSASSVPACANCQGVNPFINPADSSHAQLFSAQQPAAQPAFLPGQTQQQQPNPAFQFQQRTQPAQQPLQPAFATQTFQQPQQTFQQPQQTFRQPQQTFRQPQQNQPSTLNDFQGQLSLNRFDTGFNFDFSS